MQTRVSITPNMKFSSSSGCLFYKGFRHSPSDKKIIASNLLLLASFFGPCWQPVPGADSAWSVHLFTLFPRRRQEQHVWPEVNSNVEEATHNNNTQQHAHHSVHHTHTHQRHRPARTHHIAPLVHGRCLCILSLRLPCVCVYLACQSCMGTGLK